MEQSPKIPTRPQLRPGTEIVALADDQLLLRSFSGTLMLSGEFVASQLREFLLLLDGTYTVEAITEKVGTSSRRELERFLLIMTEKDLLQDGYQAVTEYDVDQRPEKRNHEHEKAYWSVSGPTVSDPLKSLASSIIVVVGLGGIGSNITHALSSSGVGKIIGIDPYYVQGPDETFGYQEEDIGKPRVEAIGCRIAKQGRTTFVPVAESVHTFSSFDHVVSEADLVVLCSDNMAMAAYDVINAACIRHKTRWVSARIDRTRGIIGPFVVPEQTACFTCFELRSRVNSEHPTDHEALYRQWKKTDNIPDNWPIISPIVNLIGNYLALDVLKVLVGRNVSAVIGRVMYIDFYTFESSFHEILKLPRCPDCSRGRDRPLTKIWDIQMKGDAPVPTS